MTTKIFIQKYMRTYTHTDRVRHVRQYRNTDSESHDFVTHACTHTRARARAHTHTHRHTCAHTQIEYVMCDKTGTLTQNQMIFRQCSVGGRIYADPLSGELGALADDDKAMRMFLRLLAACNEVCVCVIYVWYVCMYVCVYICTHAHIHTHACMHTCIVQTTLKVFVLIF
jgi:hypothetical protein